MRRVIIISIMFIAIITAAVASFYTIQSLANNLTDTLDQLEKEINNEEWSQAENLNNNLKNDWERAERVVTLFIDHADLRDLNISLNKISFLIEIEEKNELLTEISIARDLIQNIPEEEKLLLRNVF